MSIGQAIANLFGGGQAPVQQAQPQQPQQAQRSSCSLTQVDDHSCH